MLVSATVRVRHFHEVDTLCFLLWGELVQCQIHVLGCNREILTLFVCSEVDVQEMEKEGKCCVWDPYNSIYVQDDLKSITVPLYLKGAKLFWLHFFKVKKSSGNVSLSSRVKPDNSFLMDQTSLLTHPVCCWSDQCHIIFHDDDILCLEKSLP